MAALLEQVAVDVAKEVAAESTPVRLDTELAAVSGSIHHSVERLRTILAHTEALEANVQALLKQKDATEAFLRVSQTDAEKIGRLMASQTEERMQAQMKKLTQRYESRLADAERRANSAAWKFGIGGVLAGAASGLLVEWMASTQFGW
ncbi:hypothetical protein GCM10022251_77260 [Phytohabitans flavus]|uniref:Uncharacterized protein n=1 Tax=Phytohabitans flavus TaxID=1076124 RepID=A0A6F8XIP8_9ACTN|nr:hypothetical protein Pflav_000950 [Phytohabitans flavus]